MSQPCCGWSPDLLPRLTFLTFQSIPGVTALPPPRLPLLSVASPLPHSRPARGQRPEAGPLHVKMGHSISCTSLSTSVRKSTVTSRSPLGGQSRKVFPLGQGSLSQGGAVAGRGGSWRAGTHGPDPAAQRDPPPSGPAPEAQSLLLPKLDSASEGHSSIPSAFVSL